MANYSSSKSLEFRIQKLEETLMKMSEEGPPVCHHHSSSENEMTSSIYNEMKILQAQNNIILAWIKTRFGVDLTNKDLPLLTNLIQNAPAEVKDREIAVNDAFFEGLFWAQDIAESATPVTPASSLSTFSTSEEGQSKNITPAAELHMKTEVTDIELHFLDDNRKCQKFHEEADAESTFSIDPVRVNTIKILEAGEQLESRMVSEIEDTDTEDTLYTTITTRKKELRDKGESKGDVQDQNKTLKKCEPKPLTSNIKEKSIICKTCHRSFYSQWNLTKHILQKHPNGLQKRFDCKICQKRFDNKFLLKLHLKIHNPHRKKAHKCKFCRTSYYHRQTLGRHLLEKHNIEGQSVKYYDCQFCQRRCISTYHLKRHMEVHDPERKRQHGCEYCSHTFYTKQQLHQHLRKLHPRSEYLKIIGTSTD